MSAEVVEWISQGKTLREFCRQEGKPCYATVYDWLDKDEEFSTRFARAREQGEDVIAQECLEIADDSTNDYIERTTKSGEDYTEFNAEHVQRSKLRIDTRLKLLSKWNPKKYGDRIDHNHGGNVGLNLINDIPRPSND